MYTCAVSLIRGAAAVSRQHECMCQERLPSRRAVVGALASLTLVSPVAAQRSEQNDEYFMRIAIEEARQADFPFGAVIVREGAVLARGRNLGRSERDPTAHGEMVA